MTTNPPSHGQTTALVLGMVGSALRVAAEAADNPAAVAGAWEPVATEYARLLAGTRDHGYAVVRASDVRQGG